METDEHEAEARSRSNPDSRIPVRRLSGSLSSDIPRYWHGGHAFATHFFNALSSTFPFGEAFFVRSVQHYRDQITDPALRQKIQGFAGQEGQHSRSHDEHMSLLLGQGYPALATRNRIGDWMARWNNRHAPRVSLATTASLEHLTALLARQILSDPDRRTADMHPDMARLWRWHAMEEAEHKAVAFDVLGLVAPSRARRIVAMILSTLGLAIEVFDRVIYMLWKDGLLFDRETWSRGWRFLLGEGGFLRGLGADYLSWFGRDFHPDDVDDRPLIKEAARLIDGEIAA
jgi:predicted metal-dependent hydrolase